MPHRDAGSWANICCLLRSTFSSRRLNPGPGLLICIHASLPLPSTQPKDCFVAIFLRKMQTLRHCIISFAFHDSLVHTTSLSDFNIHSIQLCSFLNLWSFCRIWWFSFRWFLHHLLGLPFIRDLMLHFSRNSFCSSFSVPCHHPKSHTNHTFNSFLCYSDYCFLAFPTHFV